MGSGSPSYGSPVIRRWLVWAVTTAACVGSAVACGRSVPTVSRFCSPLPTAISKMEKLRSFVVEVSSQRASPSESSRLTEVYVAPDEYAAIRGGQYVEIVKGTQLYLPYSGRPGYYNKLNAHTTITPISFFDLVIELLDRYGCHAIGPRYAVHAPGSVASLSITLSAGYVNTITEKSGTTDPAVDVFQYTNFNTAPAIAVPTAAQVLKS